MKKAVALAYKIEQDRAPRVAASGKGLIAQSIIEKAKNWDIPLFQNEALVESLINLKVQEEIPPKLYQAIVELFIWLNHCQKNAELSKEH